jgi:hypothetical protein
VRAITSTSQFVRRANDGYIIDINPRLDLACEIETFSLRSCVDRRELAPCRVMVQVARTGKSQAPRRQS